MFEGLKLRWAEWRFVKAANAINLGTVFKMKAEMIKTGSSSNPEGDDIESALTLAPLLWPIDVDMATLKRRAKAAYAISPAFCRRVPIWRLLDRDLLKDSALPHASYHPVLGRLNLLVARWNGVPGHVRRSALRLREMIFDSPSVESVRRRAAASLGSLPPSELQHIVDFLC